MPSFLFYKKGKENMNEILKKLENENEAQYIYRIGQAKDSGLVLDTWETISPILNKELGYSEEDWKGSCAWRKRYRNYLEAYEQIFSKENFVDEQLLDIEEKTRELEKAKIKLRDERTDYQKSLREDARKESFVELIHRAFSYGVESFEYKNSPIIDSNEDMVVCLSDLHAGIVVNNWWNTYDTKILKARLHKYLDEICDIQKLHKCKVCNVVLGGDNISGLIHQNLRLQNNENVIKQLKIAVEYIGDFVYTLQDWFEEINVYSVPGNHSRMSANKEEHLKGEELDDMIPFCLGLKFANNKNVHICDYPYDKYDNTIVCFETRGGKRFYVVHGDYDKPSNVVKNLTLMTGVKPDGIIMGHRHHNSLDSEHNVKVIQCGCVVGADDYCVSKRISGEPEQCVFITSENRTVKCLYDVGLN
jgi:predicted phosphodiesterase